MILLENGHAGDGVANECGTFPHAISNSIFLTFCGHISITDGLLHAWHLVLSKHLCPSKYFF